MEETLYFVLGSSLTKGPSTEKHSRMVSEKSKKSILLRYLNCWPPTDGPKRLPPCLATALDGAKPRSFWIF